MMMIQKRATLISVGKTDCEDDNENDVQYKCIIDMPKMHMYTTC